MEPNRTKDGIYRAKEKQEGVLIVHDHDGSVVLVCVCLFNIKEPVSVYPLVSFCGQNGTNYPLRERKVVEFIIAFFFLRFC
jgi:hypothetical protein